MEPAGEGWFEVTVSGVAADAAYCFRLADGQEVPDPASHDQPQGLDGPSVLVDHTAYRWQTADWRGRPWEESVLSEIHVGTFTEEGTYAAATRHLAHLANTGINALEILPLAQMPGERGWGYDGVLHYAPHHAYGRPDELKAFVDAAHAHGIAVYLDVVYNHFGPRGNVLPLYAPGFFNADRPTPWGASVNFSEASVRRYFIENALHWFERYRFDGLRLDATHEIYDTSEQHVLAAVVAEVRARLPERNIHLIAEGQRHRPGMIAYRAGRPLLYDAGWNDHVHQALNVMVTGETGGYYGDFAAAPERGLALALEGRRPGGRSDREIVDEADYAEAHWPPQAFMNFLQNHDQVGNRAFGDRLWTRIDPAIARVLTAFLILAPQVPLVFMGDEYGETRPFLFFADYEGEIGQTVRDGRRAEAVNFSSLPAGDADTALPDPLDVSTFLKSKLDWRHAKTPAGRDRLALHRQLIALRRRHIIPLLALGEPVKANVLCAQNGTVAMEWLFTGGGRLTLGLRLGMSADPLPQISGTVIWRDVATGDPVGTAEIVVARTDA
jgi:malto-oligosyltrehalose trehalohydrolase